MHNVGGDIACIPHVHGSPCVQRRWFTISYGDTLANTGSDSFGQLIIAGNPCHFTLVSSLSSHIFLSLKQLPKSGIAVVDANTACDLTPEGESISA
jgi:hypothetical protein